jgi:polyhydroxyalkanoate synthesis regulator phasin
MKKTARNTDIRAAVASKLDGALKNAADRVEALADETKAVAARVEKQVVTAANRVNIDVLKARKDATKMAEQLSKKVTGTVENAIEKALHRFNVPTRRELKDLTQKVDTLGRKIDGLAFRRARGAGKRTRRAA